MKNAGDKKVKSVSNIEKIASNIVEKFDQKNIFYLLRYLLDNWTYLFGHNITKEIQKFFVKKSVIQ